MGLSSLVISILFFLYLFVGAHGEDAMGYAMFSGFVLVPIFIISMILLILSIERQK